MQELLEYRKNILEGKKIKLRTFTSDDKLKLAELWNEDTILLGNRARVLATDELNNIKRFEERGSNADYSGFSLSILNQADELVGAITLSGISLPTMNGTIAIMIAKKHQNKGYGKEALQKGLDLAFLEYNCHKVELYVYSFNKNAIALYSNLGFREEGISREAIYQNGRYYDVVNMGILREEYFALRNE